MPKLPRKSPRSITLVPLALAATVACHDAATAPPSERAAPGAPHRDLIANGQAALLTTGTVRLGLRR